MSRIEKRTAAQLDLIEAWGYLATEAIPEVADRLLDHIEERLKLLADNPGMGKARPDIMQGLRSFPVEQYMVYYMPLEAGAGIEVIRVLHQRQDIEGEF